MYMCDKLIRTFGEGGGVSLPRDSGVEVEVEASSPNNFQRLDSASYRA